MTPYDYFTKAEQCETAASEIYAHLAKVFEAQAMARTIFARLADEEVQHATRLRLLGSRHVRDAALFRQAGSALPDVQAALEYAQASRNDALAGRWGTDVDAVMQRAGELEERLGAFHAETVARLVQPELQGFFSTLVLQDGQHRDLLWSATSKGRK